MADPVIPDTSVIPAAAAEPAVDAKALQAEIERLKTENSEKDTATRYWYEQAKGGKPAETAKPAAAEVEEDLLEVLTKRGGAGLKEVLKKQGFVEASEVETRINQRAQVIATENELAGTYPDLKDAKSEFFKETAKHYAELVREGTPQHVAMKQAAKLAALDGYVSGKRLPAAEKEEREARARAQSGEKGRKATEAEPENDDLDKFQQYICDAMDVKPEEYKKRAKEGVRIGGRVS